jgi:hypothetical protein
VEPVVPTAEATSLFEQPWWLDAVAPGHWDELLLRRGDHVVARWPYVLSKRCGLTAMRMPPLTPTLGPWLMMTDAKYYTEVSRQMELLEELIARLPRADYICQALSPQISSWLPFYWAGFEQTTRYTYRLFDISDPDAIWNGMDNTIRRNIRKAEKRVEVNSDLGIDELLRIVEMSFRRQGKSMPYRRDLVYRLDAACARHNCRRMFFAEDAAKRIHAAAFIVWDQNAAYYLMGGGDPELRSSGAHAFLLWKAFNFCASVTTAFDFEGSALRNVEHFFRAFGARQVPYLVVRWMSRRLRLLNAARVFCRALLFPEDLAAR